MKTIDESYFSKTTQQEKKKPEDFLEDDERILFRGMPNKKAYVAENSIKLAPVAIVWLFIDVAIILFVVTSVVQEQPGMLAFFVPFFLLHMAPVWIWLATIIKSYHKIQNEKYFITNKRIFVLSGEKIYLSQEVKLADIREVNVKRSSTDKMIGVGDIYITGKEKNVVLFDMKDFDFLAGKLEKLKEIIPEDSIIENEIICPYCGSSYDRGSKFCPGCGSRIK